MDVIKMEPDINPLSMQTSDAEEKPLSEEGDVLDQHFTEIKTECKGHSYDLTSEMAFDKIPVLIDFEVKSEVEEENVLDLHMTEIKTECMDRSYDLKSEMTFGDTPVPIDSPIMKSEAKEETHEFDQVEEEVKLEVTAEEDEVFTEGTGLPPFCDSIKEDDYLETERWRTHIPKSEVSCVTSKGRVMLC
ncbi:uncharacterized protein [Periplaneta americana]|uniref:uncharacterized protein isoform X4 n=1 Tax=Periplaneta americana TaxID=6978 RepID=UPI0037E96219